MIVCKECGGTEIVEFRLAGYDPNKAMEHDYDVPVRGGIDYPLEYSYCYECDTEHVDFIEEEQYLELKELEDAKDNGTG